MNDCSKNSYEDMIENKINKISENIYNDLKNINFYPIDMAKKVLKILLEYACISQNITPIEISRRKIGEMDEQWLRNNIQDISSACINFGDEWEYRRFVELIKITVPDLLEWIFEIGKKSTNEEIREVVADFNKYK